jgi:hypothetical protein
MPEVGFEPTVPASAREKTVYALDRSATVTGFIMRGLHGIHSKILEDLIPLCFEREIFSSGFEKGWKVLSLHVCSRVHPVKKL